MSNSLTLNPIQTIFAKKENVVIAVGLFVVASIILFLYAFQTQLINNGDYGRVTRSAISVMNWNSDAGCHKIDKINLIASSTMGLIFNFSVLMARLSGSECIGPNLTYTLLAATYLLGCFFYLRKTKPSLLALSLLIIPAILFSPFMKSYYEEAAVLALIPFAAASVLMLINEDRFFPFVLVASLIVFAKAQMIVFIPLFLCTLASRHFEKKSHIQKTVAASVVLALAGLAAVFGHGGNNVPNSYNRLYNGVGWAMQGVSSWPANDFNERYDYFTANQSNLQSTTNINNETTITNLTGTTFWPTGQEEIAKNAEAKKAIEKSVKFMKYLAFLESNPGIAFKLAKNTYTLAITSDYSTSYLENKNLSNSYIQYNKIRAPILSIFGFIYIAAFALLAFRSRTRFEYAVVAIYIALPMIAVVGDGFYEFEKHMIPYFMSIPLFFVLQQQRLLKEV